MTQPKKRPKPTNHIAKVFDDGKTIDAAVKRAVRKALKRTKR